MFKPTDKPKRYLAAAAFAAVLITVPCLGALNTSADQARMEWPAPNILKFLLSMALAMTIRIFTWESTSVMQRLQTAMWSLPADGKVVDVTSEKSEQGYGVSIIIAP